jgi:hypothetical protein
MDFINLIKFNVGLKGLQPILPIIIFIALFSIMISDISSNLKLIIVFSSFIFGAAIIFIEIRKYIKSFKDIILTIITIGLANLSFAAGSLIALIGLRKMFANKFYSYSRWNK